MERMPDKLNRILLSRVYTKMKNFLAQLSLLARTPQFAIVGILGVIQSISYLLHYSAETDKSGGLAYWLGIGTTLFSASYVVLFLYLRMKDRASQAKATKKEE